MPEEKCGTGNSYSAQIGWSVTILLLGLILLIIWIIVYQNRVNLNLNVEWWTWIIFSFGLFFILVGIIWLVIALYAYSCKRKYYEYHETHET